MFFHGLPASAMYYRDQRISSLYWRGMKIWQADVDSGPLRKGQLRIAGKTATFSLAVTPFVVGELEIHGSALAVQQRVTLVKGHLTIHGNALTTVLKADLADGTLNIHGNALSTLLNVGLAKGQLAIHGNTGSFTLTGSAILSSGSLTLVRKTAVFRENVTLAAGNLRLTRSTASFRFISTLARGNLYLHPKTALLEFKATLATRMLNIHGNAATLGLTTVTDPSFSSVVLLCGFDGTNGATSTTDASPSPKTLTFVGDAQLSTAQKKLGASSVLFDGTGDAVTIPNNADFNFGAGKFTVEFFIRFATGFSTNEAFCGQWGATQPEAAWYFFLSSGSLLFRMNDTGSTSRDTSVAWTPTVNTWYHLAVDRDASNKFRVYRDGVMVASATYTQTMKSGSGLFGIGTVPGFLTTYPLNGWIDELRITKGVARYASDSGFSVPTVAFPRS